MIKLLLIFYTTKAILIIRRIFIDFILMLTRPTYEKREVCFMFRNF